MIWAPAIRQALRLFTQLREQDRARLDEFRSGGRKLLSVEERIPEDITRYAIATLESRIADYEQVIADCSKRFLFYIGADAYRAVAGAVRKCQYLSASERMDLYYIHRVQFLDTRADPPRDATSEQAERLESRVAAYERYIAAHGWTSGPARG